MKRGIILIIAIITFSCRKNSPEPNNNILPLKTIESSDLFEEITVKDSIYKIPKTIIDTLKKVFKKTSFQIETISYGYLDRLDYNLDIAMIIIPKDKPETIVVFKNKTNHFQLIGKNELIISKDYQKKTDFYSHRKLFFKENQLRIELTCDGSCGNTYLSFEENEDQLYLQSFFTHDVAAGSEVITQYTFPDEKVFFTIKNSTISGEMVDEKSLDFSYPHSKNFNDFDTNKMFLYLTKLNSEVFL